MLSIVSLAFVVLVSATASRPPASSGPADLTSGRDIFRHDTFGDEQLWTAPSGCTRPLRSSTEDRTLSVGPKVDVSNLPRLTALKNRYDPTKCFQRNSNVDPRTL